MIEKIDPKLKLDKTEEIGDLGQDNNVVTTVESVVSISEPKEQNVVLNVEAENKGIEEIPLSCRDDEDVEVNIIGNSGLKGVEDNCVDPIEIVSSSESSFGGGGSDSELSDFDDEVETRKNEEWRKYVRKRKVTDHWRRFINPIMRRCKWVEGELRKLKAQAKKYEKEIAEYDQQKQLDCLKFAVDVVDVKSVRSVRFEGIQRNKVMRRKKRKRAEECDSSLFMSNHRLFSYYVHKKRDNDGPVEDLATAVVNHADYADNVGEFKVNDIWPSIDDHKEADKSSIDILENIEEMLSKVEKLKTQIDTIINENPGSFAQAELYVEGDNPLSTHDAKAPLIENIKNEVMIQNQTDNEELHDSKNVMVKAEDKSVEEQKSIAPAPVSDSDIDTKNVVPNVGSIQACSSSKTHFTRNIRRAKRKFGS